ncbi:MAG: hypothetical protein GXP31_04000 [Kiritimatiellaeota bacterium]|nr:hypothetical protein [Kiritimatiellota bacterium]
MTSKERVRTAVAGGRPDKTPLGFYVVDYDIIESVIGRPTFVRNKVKAQLALWEGRRDEVVESYKHDTVDFYRKIDVCDVICFKEAPIVPPKDADPGPPPRRIADDKWEDVHGRIYQVSTISNELVCVRDPEKGVRRFRVEQFSGPVEVKPPDPSIFEACDYLIDHLGSDRYIAGRSGALVGMLMLGGMEQGLMEYLLHPEVVRAAIRRAVAVADLQDSFYIRPGQDGVLFEQDMASTRGPHMSPAMFDEFCLPAIRERVASVKRHGMQVLLHNCGNNRVLMDRFAAAGIQCYQSLQTNADMDVASLKAEFGGRMAFWGGVDVAVLISGTPAEVRREVRNALEAGAPGGGFILGPSHSIAHGTPYDNFMAMLDEFARLRDRY